PMQMREISNVDELIVALERELLGRKLARKGDRLAILTGAPILEKGHTSLLKLHEVRG
ncbi:MAG: pyruvate kinase, partial [Acidobacteria bacterium]|nr:pyruvate kinase [Acidobacteriota bacterium]